MARGGWIVIVSDLDAVSAGLELSATSTVKAAGEPVAVATVGVPEITPVSGSRVRPSGSAPDEIDHV